MNCVSLLLLFLTSAAAYNNTRTAPVPSAKLDPLPTTQQPFGTRLFLTSRPNFLNLVWTCCVNGDKKAFVSKTNITITRNRDISNNVTGINKVTKTVSSGDVAVRFKEIGEGECSIFAQFNTTIELRHDDIDLKYTVTCEDRQSIEYPINYQHWNPDNKEKKPWSLLSVGSLGLYNTTNTTIQTLKTISENMKNALWTIPGGIVADRNSYDDPANVTEAELESWRNWLSWVRLVENVTCCMPVAAAPSPMDLYPYNATNQLQSNFRHFMELPFSSSHEELWYSFDHRHLHVVLICSACDLSEGSPQFNWLVDDLKRANANGNIRWTMVMGHEETWPQHYDSDPDPAPNPMEQPYTKIRKLIKGTREQLSILLDRYNVDFAVWSHERWYERSKPLRRFLVTDQTTSNSLYHVNGTIHYTCGTGGIPLREYTMEKWNYAARFLDSEYGVCGFHEISRDIVESRFIYTNASTGNLVSHDYVQISKKVLNPHTDADHKGHFSALMKMFGIVIVGGAMFLLLVILVLKIAQVHDPSIILDKIRNIRYVSKNNAPEEVELDAAENETRDTVMLLEEEVDPTEVVSTDVLYRITM